MIAERIEQVDFSKFAVDHANKVHENWSDQAMDLFFKFIRNRRTPFMGEEFRSYCVEHNLPIPPSLRAFGGILRRASGMGIIVSIGTQRVVNPKAHCANANLWLANIV